MTAPQLLRRLGAIEGFLELGDAKEALRLLLEIPEWVRLKDCQLLQTHLKVLLTQKDWVAASELARCLVGAFPSNAEAWYGLAVADLNAGAVETAKEALRKACELNSDLKLRALSDHNLTALW